MDRVSKENTAEKSQAVKNSYPKMNGPGPEKPASEEGSREESRQEEPAEPVWLSVVVIGQNEAANLPRLFASLPGGKDVEWLYIDSGSGDDSKAVAKSQGAGVFVVDQESVFGPGTGRYIGTLEARGEWILYLDGDMVLREEFLSFIDKLKRAVWPESTLKQNGPSGERFKKGEPAGITINQGEKSEERLHRGDSTRPALNQDGPGQERKKGDFPPPPDVAAFCGRTRNLGLDQIGQVVETKDYVTLPKREMGPPESWGKPASYHGGAVLYKKSWVLKAGNWNPALYQLEEIDLFSRVQAAGGTLRALDLPMVDHYTPYLNVYEKIKLNFLPRYRGKNLYGAGQLVTARLKEGSFWAFLKSYPYPFIVLGGLIFIPVFYFVWPPLPLLVNLAIILWLGAIKKWYYYLVYLGNLLQILRGLGRYKPFVPKYRRW
ncbi:MAG: glycosyltransferase family 2 protein [Bacillota bacterium]